MNETTIEKLKEIRKSARKMHTSYLQKQNLLDEINELVPCDNWKIKEKIDKIIIGDYAKCYCGKLSKPNSKWCSSKCKDNSIEIKSKISIKNTLNAKSRMEKTKTTVIEKYGVNHVQQVQSIRDKTQKSNEKHHDQWIRNTFSRYNLDYDEMYDPNFIQEICKTTSITRLCNLHFNDMPLTTVIRFIRRVCPDIQFDNHISGGEKEIRDFVSSLGYEIIANDRNEIAPYEIDVFIPEKRIGIEYNGLFFHKGDKERHIKKTKKCEDKNIFLIQIFEDEWIYKNEIVKSIIMSKLGLNDKIDARKTVFNEVDNKSAKDFLNDNHIQGYINGKHFGLYYNDCLMSLMTIGKCRYYSGEEILRYCTIKHVTIKGGFSKLLLNVKKKLLIDNLYTFADLRYSNGSTYEKFGKYVKTTQPGYFWYHSKSVRRISRYQSQKHKLNKLLGDFYQPELSENKNMMLAGYEKIYDCGNKLYIV